MCLLTFLHVQASSYIKPELISATRAVCTVQLMRSSYDVQEDPYSGLIGDSYRAPDEKAQFRLELQRMVTVSPCDLSGLFEFSYWA